MTPDEWLLAQYDAEAHSEVHAASVGHIRPIYQILDDHREPHCTPSPHTTSTVCRRWATPASWPHPRDCNNILIIAGSDSADFRLAMRTARSDLDERKRAA